MYLHAMVRAYRPRKESCEFESRLGTLKFFRVKLLEEHYHNNIYVRASIYIF